jgi:3-keto-5-aminohexanoate cleavage enzyme
MDELIICVAPYPGEKQEEKFPGKTDVPEEVIRSHNAGASIAHLHVRDENDLQTTDLQWFQRDVNKIHSACPIIIEGSTGGAPEHTLQERCLSFRVPGWAAAHRYLEIGIETKWGTTSAKKRSRG